MALIPVHCPYCQSDQVITGGQTNAGPCSDTQQEDEKVDVGHRHIRATSRHKYARRRRAPLHESCAHQMTRLMPQ
jgi:hypothetical protein